MPKREHVAADVDRRGDVHRAQTATWTADRGADAMTADADRGGNALDGDRDRNAALATVIVTAAADLGPAHRA